MRGRKEERIVDQDVYQFDPKVKTGSAEQLWSFIADSLQDFISTRQLQGSEEKPLPLGFTFSYPASQDYVDHGRLQTWTKGFDIKGVEGEDVAAQVRDAMAQRVGCTHSHLKT